MTGGFNHVNFMAAAQKLIDTIQDKKQYKLRINKKQ